MKKIATLCVGLAVIAALLTQRHPDLARLLFYSTLCGLIILLLGKLVWPFLGSCWRHMRARFPELLRQSPTLTHQVSSSFHRKEVVEFTSEEERSPTSHCPEGQRPVSAKMLELELLHWQIQTVYPSVLTYAGYQRVAGASRMLTRLVADGRCPEDLLVECAQRLVDDLHQLCFQLKEPVAK